MKNIFQNQKAFRSPEIYKLIAGIQNIQKRNLLRGYIVKLHINHCDVEIIRRGNSLHDSMIIGALLKGRHGLMEERAGVNKRSSNDLFKITSFPPIDWRSEVCYTAGYINSMSDVAIELLHTIKSLTRLEIQ